MFWNCGPCSTREGAEQSPCLCPDLVVVDNPAGITAIAVSAESVDIGRSHLSLFMFQLLSVTSFIKYTIFDTINGNKNIANRRMTKHLSLN